MDSGRAGVAFLVSIGAGLATSIGAAAVALGSSQNNRFLAASMALAAGVMIYVSMNEIFFKSVDKYKDYIRARNLAEEARREQYAYAAATVAFFGGVVLTVMLDMLVHRMFHASGYEESDGHYSPEQRREIEEKAAEASAAGTARRRRISQEIIAQDSFTNDVKEKAADIEASGAAKPEGAATKSAQDRSQLIRTSLITGLAIALHNFPEGLATFISLLESFGSGLPLAFAIAVHNIPEGICVAVPILFATGSKRKAFFWGTMSGLSEPLGAAIGWGILATVPNGASNDLAFAILFGIVAGMMTFISFSELIPTAIKYEPSPDRVTFWIFTGIAVMAVSLVLFKLAGQA